MLSTYNKLTLTLLIRFTMNIISSSFPPSREELICAITTAPTRVSRRLFTTDEREPWGRRGCHWHPANNYNRGSTTANKHVGSTLLSEEEGEVEARVILSTEEGKVLSRVEKKRGAQQIYCRHACRSAVALSNEIHMLIGFSLPANITSQHFMLVKQ